MPPGFPFSRMPSGFPQGKRGIRFFLIGGEPFPQKRPKSAESGGIYWAREFSTTGLSLLKEMLEQAMFPTKTKSIMVQLEAKGTQMPSGFPCQKKKGHPSFFGWLSLKGNPSPKKEKKGATGPWLFPRFLAWKGQLTGSPLRTLGKHGFTNKTQDPVAHICFGVDFLVVGNRPHRKGIRGTEQRGRSTRPNGLFASGNKAYLNPETGTLEETANTHLGPTLCRCQKLSADSASQFSYYWCLDQTEGHMDGVKHPSRLGCFLLPC